jgi:hypothetical protein
LIIIELRGEGVAEIRELVHEIHHQDLAGRHIDSIGHAQHSA